MTRLDSATTYELSNEDRTHFSDETELKYRIVDQDIMTW